ncbi:MAG TPA: helix-turn-helix transcriptional regulator [Anaerolineales bacterium]
MSLIVEQRSSESPYVESVTRGWTVADGAPIRPAESHWHMVFARFAGAARAIAVGPLTTAGTARWSAGAEVLWIKFRLGTFMPHLPTRDLTDGETILPGAAGQSFWLKGSIWQIPGFEDVETFVSRLVHDEILVHDPVVGEALQGRPRLMSPRTLRHRFLQAAGLPQNQIFQIQRAQRAAELLEGGTPILDAVQEAGYFDQPHLTRALKQWVGRTPGEIAHPASAL